MEREESDEGKMAREERDRRKPYLGVFFICRDLFRCVHRKRKRERERERERV